jgi:hypothetical protein
MAELTLGEIKYGKEIGQKLNTKFTWHACVDCGKERWVQVRRQGKLRSERCQQCANKLTGLRLCGTRVGRDNPHWKGGKYKDGEGYLHILLESGDFFYPMVGRNGYVLEHRLVMARHLRRCLLPWEVVHHKNGIRDDNRLENLELLPTGKYHLVDTVSKARIAQLEKRVTLLEAENILLKEQIEGLGRRELWAGS